MLLSTMRLSITVYLLIYYYLYYLGIYYIISIIISIISTEISTIYYYFLLLSIIWVYLRIFTGLDCWKIADWDWDGPKTVLRHIPHHPTEKKHDVYMCLPKDLNTIYIYIYIYIPGTSLDWKKRSVSKKTKVFGKRIGKNNLEGYQVHTYIYGIVVSSKFASQFQKSYGFDCVLVKPYSYGP